MAEAVASRSVADRGAGVADLDAFEVDLLVEVFLCDFLSRRPPVPSSSESENSSSRWILLSRSATVKQRQRFTRGRISK